MTSVDLIDRLWLYCHWWHHRHWWQGNCSATFKVVWQSCWFAMPFLEYIMSEMSAVSSCHS